MLISTKLLLFCQIFNPFTSPLKQIKFVLVSGSLSFSTPPILLTCLGWQSKLCSKGVPCPAQSHGWLSSLLTLQTCWLFFLLKLFINCTQNWSGFFPFCCRIFSPWPYSNLFSTQRFLLCECAFLNLFWYLSSAKTGLHALILMTPLEFLYFILFLWSVKSCYVNKYLSWHIWKVWACVLFSFLNFLCSLEMYLVIMGAGGGEL